MSSHQNIKLWELAGDEEKRVFSPYAWRIRLMLVHKQIKYETIPWRYSDKDLIKPYTQARSCSDTLDPTA